MLGQAAHATPQTTAASPRWEDQERRLRFQADILEEVVRNLQFRTYGASGCVILKEVTITAG